MSRYLLLYALTVPVFLVVDLVWIGVVARNLYQGQIGDLLLESPRWAVAIAFYLLYIVGILALAAVPAHLNSSFVEALWRGALLGLVAYATYDLTNMATMKGWSPLVTVVDLVWGAVLTAIVSSAAYFIAGWLDI
jgi:uncharacterized membrane protein